jgi:Kef-type K+ transport system membrane component KefB
MDHGIVSDLAICIVVAWIMAVIAQVLKQPLILAYLGAGVLVGPVGIGLIQERVSIETISSLGLILLLFMIGLEIDLKRILGAGRLITVTALVQIGGSCLLGLLLFRWLGYPLNAGRLDALYLAVAVALSSTVIIVKVLHERRELDTLPGRLTLGILVLQDLFAILFLAVQPNLKAAGFGILAVSLLKVSFLVAIAFAASRYALPALFRLVARLPELVLVGALAWCFLVAGLAGSLHLSREMGALVAGVAISTFPYTLDIAAKLASIRDFFVTLFFVALGMSIPAPALSTIGAALLFCFVLVGSRVVTVFPPLYWMRQGLRASLLPTIHLSQVSELALVILALGAASGHVGEETRGMVAYAFVFLAVASTYAIAQGTNMCQWAIPLLSRAGLRDLDHQTEVLAKSEAEPSIFLLGFSWTASSLLEHMMRHQPGWVGEVKVIDFNPHVNQELRQRGIPAVYGDISQRETLVHAGVANARIILCTLPNSVLKGTSNSRLLKQLREISPKAQIIVHADFLADVRSLYEAGASYVSVPRLIEAEDLCRVIDAARSELLDEKRAEIERDLAGRHEVIP